MAIDTTDKPFYYGGVVALHGELAVPYTRNPPQRGGTPPFGRTQGPISAGTALTAGSHAAQARQPRQVREEATVRDALRAPWERLARAAAAATPPGLCQRAVRGHLSGYPAHLIYHPGFYHPDNPVMIVSAAAAAAVALSVSANPSAAGAARPAHRKRKSLGQHFLADARIANRIVAAAQIDAAATVLEIGPGAGILTRRLVQQAGRVIAVELDANLAGQLAQRLDYPANLTVINADARTLDIAAAVHPAASYQLVANLPYYAASPIIRRFLESDTPPSLLVVMVQREVADAMCAAPGAMSLLSVATQFYAAASVVAQVPPRAFRPPPKVASTAVKLMVRAAPAVAVADREAFFALVRAGFAAPRKQLRNSLLLGSGSAPDAVAAALDAAGLDGQRRPATLSLSEWATLDAAWPTAAPRIRSAK